MFTAGNRAFLERPAVAIVGTRRATEGGRRFAERVATALAEAHVTVISGLALGIDGAAHRGALSGPGSTVAVLGSGADRPAPAAHAALYRRIRTEGLVVSEFLPGAPARPHAFPQRNRLIAALARAVVVVEAGRRSGALITVDHALDLGRDVFAVPGPLTSRQSEGTNALIRDGARILLEPDQLLEELGVAPSAKRPTSPSRPRGVSANALRLWEELTPAPRHVDQVAHGAELDVRTTLAGLTELELDGWAVQLPGMRYALATVDGSQRPSPIR